VKGTIYLNSYSQACIVNGVVLILVQAHVKILQLHYQALMKNMVAKLLSAEAGPFSIPTTTIAGNALFWLSLVVLINAFQSQMHGLSWELGSR
jgi:hypothetical protein